MSKVSVGVNVSIPMPVTVVGTGDDGSENYMAVGWISKVNGNPPLIAIGIGKARKTNRNIVENREFSINFPSEKDLKRTDYVGIVSGNEESKAGVFTSIYGKLKKAPLIEECPLSIACTLFKRIELPTHDLFLGEVVDVFAEEKFMEMNTFHFPNAKTFFLTMPDNTYWSFGERIGTAGKDGKDL